MRLILHVALFACQNLSLIVRGHCSHKADAVPKDMFCLVFERLKESEVPLKSNTLRFPRLTAVTILQIVYTVLDLRLCQTHQL